MAKHKPHEYIDRMFVDFDHVDFQNAPVNKFGYRQVFLELRRVRDGQRLAWMTLKGQRTFEHPRTGRLIQREAEASGRFVCFTRQSPPGLRLPGHRVKMAVGEKIEIIQIGRYEGPPQRWKVGAFSPGTQVKAEKR